MWPDSWLISWFSAQQRFRMTFQIIGERIERLQRPREFLQRLMNVRLQRRILLQRALRVREGLLRGGQRVTRFGRYLGIELLEKTVRVLQRAVQVVANIVERNLVQLLRDIRHLELQFVERVRDSRQVE